MVSQRFDPAFGRKTLDDHHCISVVVLLACSFIASDTFFMDEELIGHWRVKSFDMIEGHTVSLIGGLVGEIVEFTADGRYRVDVNDSRPGASNYRAEYSGGLSELDIWVTGLETLVARCVYKISGSQLTICIAGNYGERPTEIRRDDERLWCVITSEKTELPKRRKARKVEPLLEPGSLIPEAFLNKRPKP